MSNELADAADLLDSASEAASTGGDRLAELSDQLDELAAGERHADHGRLARIQAAIDEVQPDVDDDVATTIEDAREKINDYRETIEGV